MIISHDHRFIFIRTYKTGGTSVELSLARFLGPLDILTPEHPEDEMVRIRYNVFPQNFVFTKGKVCTLNPREEDDVLLKQIEAIDGGEYVGFQYFGTHNSAKAIREAVGPRIWNGYTKFCIERNPFEFLISLYYWNMRKKSYDSFMQFLEENRETGHNWPSYFIDGKVAVDIIIDHANLRAGLTSALKGMGIDFDGWLPSLKSKTRRDKRPWHEMLKPEEIAYIRQYWRTDLEIYWALSNHADPRLNPECRP